MPEEPSIPVIVERLANVQDDVTEIKRNMATRTDQAHVDDRIKDLVGALASERAERVAAVEKEALARTAAVEKEALARHAADDKEAGERKKVAERLQVVEDRMEARKYNVGIAIALSVLGSGLGVIALAFRPLFGG